MIIILMLQYNSNCIYVSLLFFKDNFPSSLEITFVVLLFLFLGLPTQKKTKPNKSIFNCLILKELIWQSRKQNKNLDMIKKGSTKKNKKNK